MSRVPFHPGDIRWTRTPSGGMRATLSIGGMTIAGESTADECAHERALQDSVGWKLSFKTLGKAMKSIASPKALLKLAASAGALIEKVPGAKLALLATGPAGMSIAAGLAATKALARASAGDPASIAIVQKAEAVAAMPPSERAKLPAPSTPEGEVVRYLVAIQRAR